ncbi:putative pterin-4-alpha-carbinolamine dehydratase chloroplastic [Bienertia sinuspersici]
MATTTSSTTSLFYSLSSPSPIKHNPSPSFPKLLPFRRRSLPTITATGPDILGDFGARDPFPAELESQFGEKVLGNVSTEHKILIPQSSALSLSQQSCVTVSSIDPPLSKHDAKQLLFKLLGWRLLEEETEDGVMVMKLHCLWKLKDFDAGVELQKRISDVAENAGHHNSLVLKQESNVVTAQLWTQQINGLSINDFIVAAKIDQVQVSDLLPKKRFWA